MTTSQQLLERPEGRLSYDVTGPADGPLVVCSPGLGDLRATYRALAPALAEAGYRVATVDLRGHGGSSTGWSAYGEADIAADLVALITELGGGPAVIVGNSLSGSATVIAAAGHPELVRGIVLAGAFVREPAMNAVAKASTWLITSTPLGRRLWTSYVPKLYGTKPADFAEYRALLSANLAEPGRFAAVAGMAKSGHPVVGAALGAVSAPALVVMGTVDPDFPDPAAEAAFTAEQLGGPAEVLLVEAAGHYPHLERADVVTPAVLAFLAGL